MTGQYDVIIIGGGAAGVPAAIRTAQLGGKVAVVENQFLGGLCMNRGCVPFGQMMVASSILGSMTLGKQMGLNFSEFKIDYSTLQTRQNELIAFMREGVRSTLQKNKVKIIKGTGKIAGKQKVAVNGNNYATKNIIIASGARWIRAEFPGADLDGVINSDRLLVSKALPQRVLLFDRSQHILEIAQFLHRFGSRVFVATPEKSILQDESKVIRSRLSKALKTQGVDIRVGAELETVERVEEGLLCTLAAKGKKESTVVDRVITMRRKAALSDLGLESVGLDHTEPYISVNNRMETAVAGIYAVGDVAYPEKSHYSHLASSGGIIAAENAMGTDAGVNPRTICRVLYTQPQVACVGLTEKEAKQQGYDVISGSAPLSMNTFGMIIAQEEGIVQIVAEKRYGQVLGIHFIGMSAAEMAAQAVIAIQLEAVLEDFIKAPFPHPTLSESVSEAARDCFGRPIYLP